MTWKYGSPTKDQGSNHNYSYNPQKFCQKNFQKIPEITQFDYGTKHLVKQKGTQTKKRKILASDCTSNREKKKAEERKNIC